MKPASLWLGAALALFLLAGCRAPVSSSSATPAPTPTPGPAFCDALPRPANRALPHLGLRGDWFEVYRVADGVFALVEPYQFQEVISYLVLGSKEALLFDSGLGIAPIAPVVRELTALPVTVLNSHTHFDHVGGNAEFERVLAMDTAYTRANMRGFPHEALTGEVAKDALCRTPPGGFDAGAYRTRAWTATRQIADGHRIDLGDRVLEVLHVPGHTPDAVALFDAAAGLLFTGDSFYEGTIWLFVPETDFRAYVSSVDRMAALVPRLKRLLPAHNSASAAPERLLDLQKATAAVREGRSAGREGKGGQVEFAFDHFSILTSRNALLGRTGPTGGSGLAAPPEAAPGGAASPTPKPGH